MSWLSEHVKGWLGLRSNLDQTRGELMERCEKLEQQVRALQEDLDRRYYEVLDYQRQLVDKVDQAQAVSAESQKEVYELARDYDSEFNDVKSLPSLRFYEDPLGNRIDEAKAAADAFLNHRQGTISESEYHYLVMQMFFRGSPDQVRSELQPLVASIPKGENPNLPVMDIGCGRGELLECLRGSGFKVVGVETSELMVANLIEKGFEVFHNDANTQLERTADGSLAGITAFHVVEHIDSEYMHRFLSLSLQKLAPGGFLLLETPNPFCFESLSYFYTDDTHIRPIQPYQLAFAVQSAGFVKLRLHFAAPTPVSRNKELDNWMRHYQNHGVLAFKAL